MRQTFRTWLLLLQVSRQGRKRSWSVPAPFAEFVSGQVISLIVGNSSCLMSMNCKVVQL